MSNILPQGLFNKTPHSNIQERLKQAALIAKKDLLKGPEPPPSIEIGGEERCAIVINEYTHPETKLKYFLIHRNSGTLTPLFRVPKDRYRYVFLHDLNDCRIFVKCKLLRIMFYNCKDTQISLSAPVIGQVEFYKCKNTNVNIRIDTYNYDIPPIPLIRIEDCRNFGIYQSNEILTYLIKLSIDTKGTIVDPKTKERLTSYDLGKLFWNDQEQKLICLSRKDGFAYVSMKYALNNISQHIITKGFNINNQDIEKVTFTNTPPIHNYFSE